MLHSSGKGQEGVVAVYLMNVPGDTERLRDRRCSIDRKPYGCLRERKGVLLSPAAYWTGIQLDEVAFPVLLTWKPSERFSGSLFDDYFRIADQPSKTARHRIMMKRERLI
jgi:hypothetical protein